MKNYMPLIFAVLLGLAAVAGVSRLLSERKQASESQVYLVAAAREIGRNEEVTEGMIMRKVVPVSAMPASAVPWNRRNLLIGQKTSRVVQMGDYLYYSDAGLSGSLGDVIGEGEWAVNLGGEKSIAHLLRPGDEVAILGTFSGQLRKDESEVASVLEKREIITKGHGEVTVVLFPRVRVLEGGGMQSGQKDSGLLVALPPQQAQFLIAAQRVCDITLALRRPNDTTNLNRTDAGRVDEKTFDALFNGLDSVLPPMGTTPAPVAK